MSLKVNDNNIIASIEKEMRSSYGAYAMSVIVGRALPDVRDGLKPGNRRILHAMNDTGNHFDKPYRKSSRVVGEVMGKYHPHGDSAIYSALVRMAQHFSLRETLVEGQGNFGSIDGDPPAAMRYTEVKLTRLANMGLLADIEKDTVDFQDNYDGSEMEPKVIPARFPNLLVNGTSGIAVGMATNIPTFNLGEVIDGCCAYVDNNNISCEELLQYIPAPDFPTGGTLVGQDKIRKALIKGHGSIVIRGKAELEEIKGRERIVITEIPYQVNKSDLLKNIEILSRNKDIEGISDIRDESNKLGIRVVIDLKRDVNSSVILNQLFKNSQLETSFGVNMVALKDGQPMLMNCLEVIAEFIRFREDVITRRTSFLLQKARARSHNLVGLLISIENIDDLVRLIKSSKDKAESRNNILSVAWKVSNARDIILSVDDTAQINDDKMYLTLEQANAILEMKLHRLTQLESDKITGELREIALEIAEYLKILQNKEYLFHIMKNEFLEVKELFSTARKTDITHDALDMEDEDFIQKEDVVVTITRGGYIKRTSLDLYREQKRGGRGKSVMATYSDDVVTEVIVTTTHRNILFFSDQGKVYRLKVYKIPQGSTQSKGRALINLIPLDKDESITSVLELGKEHFEKSGAPKDDSAGDSAAEQVKGTHEQNNSDANDQGKISDVVNGGRLQKDEAISDDCENSDALDDDKYYLFFVTAKGNARRNAVTDFSNIPTNGKIAIKLEDDQLIGVKLCKGNSGVMLSTKHGKAIRFAVDQVRVFRGRTASGVRAIRLLNGNEVVSAAVLNEVQVENDIKDAYLGMSPQDRVKLANKISNAPSANDAFAIAEKAMNKHSLNKECAHFSVDDLMRLALNEQFVLSVTERGYGKRTSVYEHRLAGRGGQGVTSVDTNKKSGDVVACFPVDHDDSIMVLTHKGCMIRTAVNNIRMTGRGAVGVKIIDLQADDVVTSVSKIAEESEDAE